MPGIGLFHDRDTRIIAQFPGKLAPAHIDRKNPLCAGLQQAIGKTAGGGAEVNGNEAGGVQLKMLERVFKLETAAADEFFRGREGDLVLSGHIIAGFLCDLAVDTDLAGENRALGAFAAWAKAALHHGLIKTCHAQRMLWRGDLGNHALGSHPRTAPVAPTSKSAVSRISQSASLEISNGHPRFEALPIRKSAIRQVWKPALRGTVSRCAHALGGAKSVRQP